MKKFLLILILVVILGGAFWLWQNRYVYFFQGDKKNQGDFFDEKREENQDEGKREKQINESTTEENSLMQDGETEINQKESVQEKNNFLPQNYCAKECQEYQNNQKEWDYCREICGFNDANLKPENNSNCESKTGTDQDFCWRKAAIAKKDISLCEQIKDQKIKESCQNRLIEEIFY